MDPLSPSLHALLLLSDSALPLGSFAFSSGLESYLAHRKPQLPTASARLTAFNAFLKDSLNNLASTSLPFVLAAYSDPTHLEDLDNDLDASTPCTVARRASVAQGRALIGVWERALSGSVAEDSACQAAGVQISAFATALKKPASKSASASTYSFPLNAHLPPLFGAVSCALGLTREETTYLFLLNHAKALLSAGVRASVLGPYQSQAVLAGKELRGWIADCTQRWAGAEGWEDAAVSVPAMDLWMGRHEVLYSRIFNS